MCNTCRPRPRRPQVGRHALHHAVQTREFAVDSSDANAIQYINNNAVNIRDSLSHAADQHISIKFYTTIDIEFHPITPDRELQETTAGFRTSPEILSSSKTADVSKILAAILAAIDNFNRRGFGWQITRVVHFSITFALYATGTRKYIYSNSKKNSIKKQ